MNIRTIQLLSFTMLLLLVQSSFVSAQTGITALINSEYNNVPDNVNVMSAAEFGEVVDLNGEWDIRIGTNKTWQKVKVPSSLEYTDKLTYRKIFFLPEDAARYHARLVILGINYNSSIWINGTYVGSHSGGYTSFYLDVLDKLLRPGNENTIEITIDNSQSVDILDLARSRPWGWKRYTGIVREIFFQLNPKVSLANWKIDYQFDSEFKNVTSIMSYLFQNYNQTSPLTLENQSESVLQEDIQDVGYYIEVHNLITGNLVKSTAANPKYFSIHQAYQDTMNVTFRNVELWSPENPVLYQLTVSIIQQSNTVIDRFRETFGFRHVVFKNDGFYLNGFKVHLNGVYRMEQHPDYGISLPWSQQREDLILIKNLGINAVRSGPYPNHPYFYTLCDQLGLLVLEEMPVNYVAAEILGSQEYIDHSIAVVREMIERDRHHPAIIGWGLGSNLDVTKENTEHYFSALSEEARSLDSRPIYYSTEILKGDLCNSLFDVTLFDLFNPDIDDLTRIIKSQSTSVLKRPIIIGRIGSHVKPDLSGGAGIDQTSVKNQAKYITELYLNNIINEQIDGLFWWGFADWKANIPVLAAGSHSENRINYLGLTTEKREPRLAFQHLSAALSNRQVLPFTFEENQTQIQGRLIYAGFAIIIILLVALKQNKWFGQNFRRSLIFPKIFFEDMLGGRNVHSWQTVVLGFGIASSFALGVASIAYFHKDGVYFDVLLSQFIVSQWFKNLIVFLIWNPILNTCFLIILFLILIWFVAAFHKISIKITGMRRGRSSSFNLLVWSAINFIFLLPFSMALYSALQNPSTTIIYGGVVAVFMIWFISRLILAMHVTFHSEFIRAIVNLMVILVMVVSGIAFYFQMNNKSFSFVQQYYKSAYSQLK